MTSHHTIALTGSATGTVRDPTPTERLLQDEVARLRGLLNDARAQNRRQAALMGERPNDRAHRTATARGKA